MRVAQLALAGVLFILLTLPGTALAYPRDDAAVVEVDIFSRADIHRLNDLNMDIMNVVDGKAQIAAIPEEIETLWANGFRPAITVENMIDAVASLKLADRGEYVSYAELTADLQAWATTYSSIAELVSIGQSVYGRDIWAMKITDNPTVEEFEAEVQWIGAHHGDETIGMAVSYYMIEYLLENYGTDPEVTWLVNEREITIIPLINPDGYVNGSRYNGNGTDLNRNYLCPNGSNAGSAFSEPETQALRAFDLDKRPVTSLTFHSGAVYVNYLWDYTYAATPDEPMIITISDVYGALSSLPVTNGADWYVADGTCQDWCYEARGEIDTTIELSVTKDPPASQIDPIFNDNRPAMLYQARMSGRGIRGLVTDAETGDPISATISIPQIGKDIYTDPDVGDYHRMVETGTYTVVCSADEYPTQTVYNVSASLDTFVIVNFALEPPPRGSIAGYVRDESMSPLVGALVELTDATGYTDVSDPTGYYEIDYIPVGTHDVRASLSGYSSGEELDVSVSDGTIAAVNFVLAAPDFFDDIESGLAEWTGSWGTTTSTSYSPSTCMTDSPGGNYGSNDSEAMMLANAIDLSSAESAELSFWHRYDTESGYDYCYVEVSTNNGSTWTDVATYDGNQSTWTEETIDLTSYVGASQVKIRFLLDSDGYIERDGWYVDDVLIAIEGPETGVDEFVTRELAISNFPNPFNPRTSVSFQMPSSGTADVRVFDAAGRLVRTLLAGDERDAGRHQVIWDGRDDAGRGVAAGVYFSRIVAGGREASAKMVLLK